MFFFYVICAGVGTTILLVQFVLLLLGLEGHGHDFSHDAVVLHGDVNGAGDSTSHLLGVLSVRTLVAAVAFFGLVGVATSSAGFSPYSAFLTSIAAGGAAMVFMAWLMRSLYRLRSEGNVQIENAIGETGTVYLTIPAGKSGAGKVTVEVQERFMEYPAMTAGPELATGTPVVVVGVIGGDILEVALLANEKGD